MTNPKFFARRIKQLREHIKAMHAHEGFTPYVRDLLCFHSRLIAQAHAD